LTALPGRPLRSNQRTGRDWGFRPSRIIVVSAPWFWFALFRSSHASTPVAPGCRLRGVDGPEVAARAVLPGHPARSTFVSRSGAAKSAAVVLFHHSTWRRRFATPPESSVLERA